MKTALLTLICYSIIICLHAQSSSQRYIAPVKSQGPLGYAVMDANSPTGISEASSWTVKPAKYVLQFVKITPDTSMVKYFNTGGGVSAMVSCSNGSSIILDYSRAYAIDSTGHAQWGKQYSNFSDESTEAFSIHAVQDKNDVDVATSIWESTRGRDITVLKILISTGKIVSQLQLSIPDSLEDPRAIKTTTDKGLIILGQEINDRFDDYNPNMLLIKLDSASHVEWVKKIASSVQAFWPQDVIQTKDGGYAVCGSSTFSGTTGMLLKFSAQGNFLWGNNIAATSSNRTDCFSLCENADSSITCLGSISYIGSGRAFIANYTNNGKLTWSKSSIDEYYYNTPIIKSTGKNTFIAAGTYSSVHGSPFFDLLIFGNSDGDICSFKNEPLTVNSFTLAPEDISIPVIDITNTAKSKNSTIRDTTLPYITRKYCSDNLIANNSVINNTTDDKIFNASIAPTIIIGNTFSINVNSKTAGKAYIIVKTTSGRVITSDYINITAGVTHKSFTEPNMNTGFYYVNIIMDNQQQQLKFFKN